ncbi:acyl-CoA thioesterase/bile acid-CoA:amino acid N-acyltransferase family protein [Alkalihalobacterium bogoriense]|uniref:acyl-CoA thioesterase/bile acid-CoA:amino acid N-acyltransferase family protein n=1 Tax=Alkalihalobacterium bogoriense TaxID=246272 RepID=UPI000478BEDB|nr:acyl-CoA thioester hydrolase/BAAT C-terminal domain-containing protein [Alkalihalobacterium bogoriense]
MTPSLQVTPLNSYIDEEVLITVTGCPVNKEVTIQATAFDEKEKEFCSHASFRPNQNGIVDLSRQKPIAGTYDEADSAGLFWSMKHLQSKWDDYFEKVKADEVKIKIDLLVEGEKHESVTVTRHFYKEGVTKEAIQFDEVRGTLFYPESEGRFPAVIVLSGSDGGMQEHAAALLATKGYVTLALSYFAGEGVPKDLENIRLEYFEKATMWLKEHRKANGEVSLIGYSRGGELVLLLGATYDYYTSIIAGAPSAYVTAGMKNGIFAPVPAWSFNEDTFPYIKFKYKFSTMFHLLKNWITRNPISYLSIWGNSLKNEEAVKEARIQVENIKAPVMFIAGGDDQLWPSERYVKIMEKHVRAASDPSPQHRFLYYKNAGHFLSFPYSFVNLPANVFMNTGGGMTMTFGGTKAANAAAAKETWGEILEFLQVNTALKKDEAIAK